MPRPRDPDVPARIGVCPIHGSTEFRVHKVGFDKNGKQRYRARCPQCHSNRNTEK